MNSFLIVELLFVVASKLKFDDFFLLKEFAHHFLPLDLSKIQVGVGGTRVVGYFKQLQVTHMPAEIHSLFLLHSSDLSVLYSDFSQALVRLPVNQRDLGLSKPNHQFQVNLRLFIILNHFGLIRTNGVRTLVKQCHGLLVLLTFHYRLQSLVHSVPGIFVLTLFSELNVIFLEQGVLLEHLEHFHNCQNGVRLPVTENSADIDLYFNCVLRLREAQLEQ